MSHFQQTKRFSQRKSRKLFRKVHDTLFLHWFTTSEFWMKSTAQLCPIAKLPTYFRLIRLNFCTHRALKPLEFSVWSKFHFRRAQTKCLKFVGKIQNLLTLHIWAKKHYWSTCREQYKHSSPLLHSYVSGLSGSFQTLEGKSRRLSLKSHLNRQVPRIGQQLSSHLQRPKPSTTVKISELKTTYGAWFRFCQQKWQHHLKMNLQ